MSACSVLWCIFSRVRKSAPQRSKQTVQQMWPVSSQYPLPLCFWLKTGFAEELHTALSCCHLINEEASCWLMHTHITHVHVGVLLAKACPFTAGAIRCLNNEISLFLSWTRRLSFTQTIDLNFTFMNRRSRLDERWKVFKVTSSVASTFSSTSSSSLSVFLCPYL